ncbi:PspC domain-containing protein [archaeon]|nr:MAG: PspC domain-containing protein [archaeon]
MKRLYRSRKDSVLGGVAGGIAHYLEVDPTLIRLLWILFLFAGGSGVLAYIVCWIIIPEEPREQAEQQTLEGTRPTSDQEQDHMTRTSGDASSIATLLVGLVILAFGVLWLLRTLGVHFALPTMFWFFNWAMVFPLIVIFVALAFIVKAINK